MNIFGSRVKELRLENGISRKKLAEMLSVSQRLISYWENGERECNFATLVKLCEIFSVSADYLLGIKDY